MSKITELRAAYDAAVERMHDADQAIEDLPVDAPVEDVGAASVAFDEAEAEVARCKANVDKAEARAAAVASNPRITPTVAAPAAAATSSPTIKVGETIERTYRPDAGTSFYKDMVDASRGNRDAAERLYRHQAESRDITTATTDGGDFVPPGYLGELWAEKPREGRPFADVLPKLPLPDKGMSFSVPLITTGVSAAVQTAEEAAVSETDIVTVPLAVPVRTIAGQQDVSLQLLERSDPMIDRIIFGDLQRAYDGALDTQLISGSGGSGQHRGLDNVTSINTTTYVDATPTAAELVPKIYDAIQLVASNRYEPADTILMHPRRAAWLASNLSSTFPLFQLGTLTQAAGEQGGGFVNSFSGLRVVLDANITTTAGTTTNEDAIYVVRTADMYLAEGAVKTRVMPEILGGTLQVRLQLYAYSMFISARQPKSITKLSGFGLAAPTF